MIRHRLHTSATLLILLAGCGDRNAAPATSDVTLADSAPDAPVAERANLQGAGFERIGADELERGRRDPAWRRVVGLPEDGNSTPPSPERWTDISADAINGQPTHLPLGGSAEGPSVLAVQILLDRALFSPGVMDGYWGKNTEKAVFWFQRREGLEATGRMDRATFERLVDVAASPEELIRRHRLSASDVEGPFVELPEDIYEKAALDCMCYESLTEKLGEMFHATPEVLRELNPGVELDALSAGDEIMVPAIRNPEAERDPRVARVVVSAAGYYVHALDSAGRILFHFPSTLGGSYTPDRGTYEVRSITEEPWWHYQPELLPHVDSSEADATIPPGPNNAVGMVWMALSKPHYGIHGTDAPETIGYATSAGCIRLTNWDALFLARRLSAGTPVEFRDTH